MDASAGAGSGNAPGAGASSCCYYAQLGIRKNASCTDIRAAYRRLAMKWHPDRWASDPGATGEAKQRFQRIQEAYSVLSDRGKRAMYDAGLFDPLDDDDQVEALVSSHAYCLVHVSILFLSIYIIMKTSWTIARSGGKKYDVVLPVAEKSRSVLGRPGFLGLHAGDAGDDGQREKREAGHPRGPPEDAG